MTPEQIASDLWFNSALGKRGARPRGIIEAIATALRTARNEALEEAASECDDWIQSGPPMSACAKALASEIRALKIGGDSNDA